MLLQDERTFGTGNGTFAFVCAVLGQLSCQYELSCLNGLFEWAWMWPGQVIRECEAHIARFPGKYEMDAGVSFFCYLVTQALENNRMREAAGLLKQGLDNQRLFDKEGIWLGLCVFFSWLQQILTACVACATFCCIGSGVVGMV